MHEESSENILDHGDKMKQDEKKPETGNIEIYLKVFNKVDKSIAQMIDQEFLTGQDKISCTQWSGILFM